MLAFFVVSVLAFSAVVQSMNAAGNNTAVLLGERSNLTYDGPIDYENTAMLNSRDFARRAGWFGKVMQKFMGKSPKVKVVSVPLRWSRDGLCLADVYLGQHSLPFHVAIDTSTSLFWAAYEADEATTPLSESRGPYIPRHEGRPGFTGKVYEEEISFGGIKGTGRVIDGRVRAADPVPDYDGVLGLALSVHDPKHLSTASPFVTDFLKKYASPFFALSLTPDVPMMHINGADPRFYTGKIEYHPITRVNQIEEPQIWQIGGASIYVNGHEDVAAGVETILDTGTWGIFGPPAQVEAVYKFIRGSEEVDGRYDFFHCHSRHALAIKWNGRKEWGIDPKDFNVGQPDPSKGICEGMLKKDPHSRNTWTLGLSAMKNWYVAFDATLKIPHAGFAKLSHAPAYLPP